MNRKIEINKRLKELAANEVVRAKSMSELLIEKNSLRLKADAADDASVLDGIKSDLEAVIAKIDANQTESTTEQEEVENLEEEKQLLIEKERELEKSLDKQIKKSSRKELDKDLEILASKEYVAAYAKAVQTKDNSHVSNFLKENGVSEKTITTAVTGNGNGGLLIPKIVADKIETKIQDLGGVLALVKKVNIAGDFEQVIEKSRGGAQVHKEGTEKVEQDQEFESIKILSDFVYKKVRVTTKMDALDNGALASWIMEELPEEIVKELERLILNGKKTDAIQGITTADDKFTAKIAKSLDELSILEAFGNVRNADVIIMSRMTWITKFMNQRDKNGQPYSFITYSVDTPAVHGLKVVYTEALEKGAVVGNCQNYTLNLPNGNNAAIERSDVDKTKNNTIIYLAEILAGGAVTKLAGFAYIDDVVAPGK